MDPWWTAQQAGWIGGALGSLVGLLGAGLGVSVGLLLPKGRGKALVFGLGLAGLGVGVLALVAGAAALLMGQPYHVWYPMVLCGVIATLVIGINLPVLMNRYKQAEARRLDAEQLRRG